MRQRGGTPQLFLIFFISVAYVWERVASHKYVTQLNGRNLTYFLICEIIGSSFRDTKAVSFGFLPHNFGKMVVTYKCHLSFSEYKWGGDSTCRWWGHLNPTCCSQACLNFLYSKVVGTQKPSFQLPCIISHSYALPSCLCALPLIPV